MRLPHGFIVALTILLSSLALAQEAPYFVTYDHHLEEPRNLEIATSGTVGVPRASQKAYFAPYMELEYGAKAWWTTEFYLEGQSTRGDSTVFTGWRWENRFRALTREHCINPVLYIEYENVNEATRIQKEIVGNTPDFGAPNAELVRERSQELETKLILSSNTHSWNVSENFIVEKNLAAREGFEFGYALGVSRPLSTMASAEKCRFCRENFDAGLELYGGLGSTDGFGLHNTTHYLGPVISWQVSDNAALRFSPAIGLTHESNPVLVRFGYSYEMRGFGRKVARLFGGKP
jgi:hypothetical protein